jgi:hypothetical protein
MEIENQMDGGPSRVHSTGPPPEKGNDWTEENEVELTISLADLKARITANYDKLLSSVRHLASSLQIEKRLEGELIASALLTNNASLMCQYIAMLLDDLDILEQMIAKLVNYYTLSKGKETIRRSIDELQGKLVAIRALILSENCS